jgi:S1-C subfamily serine protease
MADHYYERPSSSNGAVILSGWLLLALAAIIVAGVWWFRQPGDSGLNSNAESRPVAARGSLTEEEKTNIEIYQTASPSVVHVTNLTEQRGQFNLNVQRIPVGTGSGFVWDTDGHIVTNAHVVQGADVARVTLADQSTYEARQAWAYPEKDIAVLWINAPKSKLRPILIGTSHDLKVGQITFAIGNPFGLDHTLTTGIVSALGREIESREGRPLHGAIQTSAAINPGNSGGPLLDSAGRLIGMTSAIVSPSGASAGIGFAIPVDEINSIVPQLIRHGKVVRPKLGVQLADDQLAEQLGVDKGALIIQVRPNSAAATAGLKATRHDDSGNIQLGDVVVAVDGKSITKGTDLTTALEGHQPGDTVTLTIVRGGKRQDVKVALQAAEG